MQRYLSSKTVSGLVSGVSLSMLAMGVAQATQAAPDNNELWQTVQKQQAEIDALRSQLNATADAVEKASPGVSKTFVGGYGEHHLTINSKDDEGKRKNNEVDAHRFVLFVGHQFNEQVKFFSELEVEHGFVPDTNCNGVVAQDGEKLKCDSGPGEVELEQAYIDWNYAGEHSMKIGQFLVPVGIINETHEPDTFYGVERNSVEKDIIPATWWETGVAFTGELAPGFNYDAAIHSGLNVDVDDGKYKVRDGRQKSAKAVAEDPAITARIKYTGVAGLELALAAQYQHDVTQGARNTISGETEDASAILLALHARYQWEALTVTALWVNWDVDGDTFEAKNADEQEGMYLEASYKIMPELGVFARHSQWDNQAGGGSDTEMKQNEVGVNYWLTDTVVLKADYSDQNHYKKADQQDSVNLGVGWSF